MYQKFGKRFLDIVLFFIGLVVLSPVLLILTVLGAIKMKGNPFFTQLRPGKDEKIFKLIKFRSMTCETVITPFVRHGYEIHTYLVDKQPGSAG